MAKNVNHIQHLKSSVVNEINGVKSPKLPNPSALTEGEIAVNFADGYETLSIKSSSGNIATFSSDSKFYTKSEIDDAEQVTAQAINDLNARVDAVSGNSHSHTNKDVLNGITAQKVSNWDAAYTSAHTHTNQSVLDNITSQNVSDWDTVTAKTDTTAFTAHISDSGLTTIHHTHDNIQYLSGISGDVGTMAYEDASDYYTKEEIDEGDRVISQSLNDLNIRVIANTDSISGLTENSHTHSNKSALDSITGSVGTMAYQNTTVLNGYADAVEYDSTDHYVKFYHGGTGGTVVFSYDASPFLIDGMVESVVVTSITSGTSEVQVLEITWNSAAGGQVTDIPLTDIFDPDLYYTKDEIDSAEQTIAQAINDLNTRVDAVSGNSHTHTNKSALDSITRNVGTMAYETASSYSSATQVNTALGSKTDTTAFTAHAGDTTMHMNSTEKTNLDSLATNIAAISGITAQKVTNWDSLSSNIEELSGETETISAALVELNANKLDTTAYTPPLESFIEPLTWSELKAKRDNGTLFVGGYYRITDFVTTTAQDNTQSANHAFDIIVRADDTDVLNENAYAIQHSGDTYFSASTLEAWELKYCIDNDTTRFAWADDANGKGVIYYMKDEFENECPYDFKNIQFKRYQLKNQNSLHIADYPMGESNYSGAIQMAFNIWKEKLGTSMSSNNVAFYYTKGVYSDGYLVNGAEIYDYSNDYESYDNGNLMFDETTSEGNYIGVVSVYDYFDVIAEVENTNGEWFYTFSKKATTSATATDASMDTDCYENFIKEYFDNGTQTLNDNIFIVVSNSIVVYGNSFDTNCYNNTFGNECYYNTFGNGCGSNMFGNYCGSNTFGNNCNYNSFGNNCYSNSFGNYCCSNSFGNYFQYNSFGNECYNNSFGNICYRNTFGNSCYRNTFGNGCGSNTFGNYCCSNSFGNGCGSNTFGNNCNHITFAKDYMYYNIVENGNQYITVTSTQTTSGSNVIRNFTIAQGVNNSTTLKTISHDTVNDTFKTIYQNSNSTIVNV